MFPAFKGDSIMTGKTVQTSIKFQDYDLSTNHSVEAYDVTLPVPGRDLAVLKDFFTGTDYFLGKARLPEQFCLYDTDENGCVDNIAHYVHGNVILPLEDYRARQETVLAHYRQDLTTAKDRFSRSFEITRPFNVIAAVKAAFGPPEPVMQWYINEIETLFNEAAAAGTELVSVRCERGRNLADLLDVDTIVFNDDLKVIYPPERKPAAPLELPTPYRPRTL